MRSPAAAGARPARAAASDVPASQHTCAQLAAHRVDAAVPRVLAQVAAELGQRALALHRRPAAALALRRCAPRRSAWGSSPKEACAALSQSRPRRPRIGDRARAAGRGTGRAVPQNQAARHTRHAGGCRNDSCARTHERKLCPSSVACAHACTRVSTGCMTPAQRSADAHRDLGARRLVHLHVPLQLLQRGRLDRRAPISHAQPAHHTPAPQPLLRAADQPRCGQARVHGPRARAVTAALRPQRRGWPGARRGRRTWRGSQRRCPGAWPCRPGRSRWRPSRCISAPAAARPPPRPPALPLRPR